MTAALPTVDVVIPAFNAERTVASAVQSCLEQTAPDLRVIVVDDGSTDGTPGILARLAARDSRVSIIRQPNAGIAAAMNRGILAGRADFVARLDADDLSAPDRHRLQVTQLMRRPDLVAISGAHREIAADGTDTGRISRPASIPRCDPDWIPAVEPALTQPFTMFRRAALLRAGLFRPFAVSEDTDLLYRLLRIGPLANLTDVVGAYRMHDGSISSASIRNGRRMALCSQLAALSASRNARELPDIDPADPALGPLLSGEGALWAAVAAIANLLRLDRRESAWLSPAVAAKLMELSGYRPYEPDPADCVFIAAALAPHRLTGLRCDPQELARMQSATAARLLRLGRLRDSARLGSRLWASVIARAVTGRLYWDKRSA